MLRIDRAQCSFRHFRPPPSPYRIRSPRFPYRETLGVGRRTILEAQRSSKPRLGFFAIFPSRWDRFQSPRRGIAMRISDHSCFVARQNPWAACGQSSPRWTTLTGSPRNRKAIYRFSAPPKDSRYRFIGTEHIIIRMTHRRK